MGYVVCLDQSFNYRIPSTVQANRNAMDLQFSHLSFHLIQKKAQYRHFVLHFDRKENGQPLFDHIDCPQFVYTAHG